MQEQCLSTSQGCCYRVWESGMILDFRVIEPQEPLQMQQGSTAKKLARTTEANKSKGPYLLYLRLATDTLCQKMKTPKFQKNWGSPSQFINQPTC